MKDFFKKYKIAIAIIITLIILFVIYQYHQKKKNLEKAFFRDNFLFPETTPCMDCGPGGMFGPGWNMHQFNNRYYELRDRARKLSGGISDAEFESAIQRAGGLVEYIKGRQTNINHIENSTQELKDVMNIPGVHGIGTILGEYIEIRVLDEDTKKKVQQFVADRGKKFIPGSARGTYGGIPVKIIISPMAAAQ